MKKLFLSAFLWISITGLAFSQSVNESKWSVSFGMLPNVSFASFQGFRPNANIFSSSYEDLRDLKPGLNLYANYKLDNLVTFRAGIGFNYCNKYIEREYPTNYSFYNATMGYLELPIIADFYILRKEDNKLFLSLGDISSFNFGQSNISGEWWDLIGPPPIPGPIQTLIYQNYLQIGIGYERRINSQVSIYISPLYRFALINYYTKGFEYRTPSAAYLTLFGVEIGIKYSLSGKSRN